MALSAWHQAPWIALGMWAPYLAVRFLDAHHAAGDCSCTESLDRILPVAPGFLGAVLVQPYIGGEAPLPLLAGLFSIVLWAGLSRLAAIGRAAAWLTIVATLFLSTLGAIALASALAA